MNQSSIFKLLKQPPWVWWAILSIALLAIALSAVYVLLSPTPEQEPLLTVNKYSSDSEILAGWQTYRNEEYGFEFKYPTGVKITQGGQDAYFEYTFGLHWENKLAREIEVGVATESSIKKFNQRCDGVGPEEYCEVYSPALCEQNSTSSCNELRHGPGGWYIRAVERDSSSKIRVEFYIYLEKVQDQGIADLQNLINQGNLTGAELVSLKLFDQILSTFKFTR